MVVAAFAFRIKPESWSLGTRHFYLKVSYENSQARKKSRTERWRACGPSNVKTEIKEGVGGRGTGSHALNTNRVKYAKALLSSWEDTSYASEKGASLLTPHSPSLGGLVCWSTPNPTSQNPSHQNYPSRERPSREKTAYCIRHISTAQMHQIFGEI